MVIWPHGFPPCDGSFKLILHDGCPAIFFSLTIALGIVFCRLPFPQPPGRRVNGAPLRFRGKAYDRSCGAAGTAPVETLNHLEITLEPVFAG
jgi:hypothetical protein